MHKSLFVILFCLGLLSGNTAAQTQAEPESELKTLVQWMTGDFSSAAQHLRDTSYFDIHLHIARIWTADTGNYWLYVEQATAATQDKPYRQRVYQVESDGANGFKSIVYTLPDPAACIGAYKNTAIFDNMKPADLILREGCTVYLTRQESGAFGGSTKPNTCESNLRGAKYANSTVTVSAEMLQSWDQGFNEKGEQVWGATTGGYEFIKQ